MLAARTNASVRLARRSFATVVDAAGLKVAAVDAGQPTVSITVLAKAGSRYQTKPGVAHSTADRSALGTVREAELYGGVLSSTLTREHLALTAEFLRGDEAFFVKVLSSAIASSKYLRHELQELVLPAVESDIHALQTNPAAHAVELAHALAFRSGLGASLFAAPHTPITAHDVEQFAATAFSKDNIAVLGTGISESALSSLVQAAFASQSGSATASTPSAYFGGETRVQAHGGAQTVFIGFGVAGAPTPEVAALAAYLDPNPTIKWAKSSSPMLQVPHTTVQSVYLPYSDAALVGVIVQGPTAEATREAAKAVAQTFKSVSSIKAEDLKAAVTKAKFRAAASVDDRAGLVEILGSKVLSGASATSTEATLSAFDSVSSASFSKVTAALAKAKPTFVAIGDTEALPYADELGL
ncbi:unnamed protein product [Mycena citricolor]|uniref:Cytochrome b-c1 complex subunit 2, mitochondrial n=1 Tax=Mycena citricolor TaxID=2018698 RepID=A0AAD2H215_9AGAR|nr:unnamed protein product [Mycena citricolor]